MRFFSQQLGTARTQRVLERIRRVIASEQFIGGPEVEAFEQALTAFFGRTALTCNSGTDALILGLKALGIGPGDDVLTTAFTYFATIEAIAAVGARPVLVDINPATYNLDPALLERAATKNTRAVLIVHLYGLACDMAPIVRFCRQRGVKLIEDCAQAFGAQVAGQQVGTFGDLGCFSFFPTKNLGGFGDGGAVTFRSRAAAQRFQLLKNHGQPKKYVHDVLGTNSRLDAIQAAVLLEKMAWLSEELAMRKKRATAWCKKYRSHPNVLAMPEQSGHTYNVFTLSVRDRGAFLKELEREGIPSAIYYEVPVYRQRAYRSLFGTQPPLACSEFAAKHVVSLPIH